MQLNVLSNINSTSQRKPKSSIFIADQGIGVGSTINSFYVMIVNEKQDIQGQNTCTCITDEFMISQTCMFCFQTLARNIQKNGWWERNPLKSFKENFSVLMIDVFFISLYIQTFQETFSLPWRLVCPVYLKCSWEILFVSYQAKLVTPTLNL